MRLFSFFLLFLFSTYSFAEEIVVELEVSCPKTSIYLADPFCLDASFEIHYLKELQNVLANDLILSGRVILEKAHPTKEHYLKTKSLKEAFNESFWKTDKTECVIQILIENKECTVSLYSIQYSHLKQFKKVSLEGLLKKDRKAIHLLSDMIYKHLFNSEGIASTSLLFALQTKQTAKENSLPYASSIWMCDYDGGNLKCLTKEGRYCISPRFYPKKKQGPDEFIYVSYDKGPSKIYRSDIEFDTSRPLIELRGNQLLPRLSKDRSKLAFICDAAGRADLFIQSIHPEKGAIGKPIQAFSFPNSVQASPCFSPDGKKIAFVSDKERTPKIFIISTPHHHHDRDLPQAECITKKNRDNTCPDWSPDGKKIAYSSLTDGIRQIWIYDLKEKKEWQLTYGPLHKENPCWAPDSLHIVFNTADTNSTDLYLVNLIDKAAVKITEGPGKKHFPAWSE